MDFPLDALFSPRSIAVVGASRSPQKIGFQILQNLLEAGYQGKIYPVNPTADEVLGLPAIHEVRELPEGIDLAVICVPRPHVLKAMKDFCERGGRSAVVISAGFKEVGGKGYHAEEALRKMALEHNVAMLGPNCLGMIDTGSKVNVSFAAGQPTPGSIAFFSQSGALCVAILDWALGENIGFSKFISLGNKAVLDETQILDHLSSDDNSKVILGYAESIEQGQAFLAAAQRVTRRKPVVMIKAGTTAAGAKAASSHTGAIAGSDQAYTAAFKQGGVIRVRDIEELFDLALAFSTQPLPAGRRIAIVTNSGGPGIIAADAAERARLNITRLSSASVERLKTFLPSYASVYNPVDIIGDATAERYARTLDVVCADPMVHAVLVIVSPTTSIDVKEAAAAIAAAAKKTDKPMFGCLMGKKSTQEGMLLLRRENVPCYTFPEPAIQSLQSMAGYAEWKAQPLPVEVCYRRDKGRVERIIAEARAKGSRNIVEFQAQGVLSAYELPTPKTLLARTSAEAAKHAASIGFPVVLKIASPHIVHKSDVGGVVVNLSTKQEVEKAFKEITARAQRMDKDAYISGCLVQEMVPMKGAREVIIGFTRDPQFGPLLMFGLGGIYVEVLRDVSFRLAPLGIQDAHDMVREIRSYHLLQGVRGEESVDFTAIEDILLTMSQLAMDFPEIHEAEFNPVLAHPGGAVVVDVRLGLT